MSLVGTQIEVYQTNAVWAETANALLARVAQDSLSIATHLACELPYCLQTA